MTLTVEVTWGEVPVASPEEAEDPCFIGRINDFLTMEVLRQLLDPRSDIRKVADEQGEKAMRFDANAMSKATSKAMEAVTGVEPIVGLGLKGIAKAENIIRAQGMKRCGKFKFTDNDKNFLAACIQKIVDAGNNPNFTPDVKSFFEESEALAPTAKLPGEK